MNADVPKLITGEMTHDVLVLTIQSQMVRDSETSYALRDQATALLGDDTPSKLVLDLRNLESIGSMGFLVFMGLRRQLSNGQIVLCNMTDVVRDMFQTCQLIPSSPGRSAPFEAAGSLDDALRQLGQ